MVRWQKYANLLLKEFFFLFLLSTSSSSFLFKGGWACWNFLFLFSFILHQALCFLPCFPTEFLLIFSNFLFFSSSFSVIFLIFSVFFWFFEIFNYFLLRFFLFLFQFFLNFFSVFSVLFFSGFFLFVSIFWIFRLIVFLLLLTGNAVMLCKKQCLHSWCCIFHFKFPSSGVGAQRLQLAEWAGKGWDIWARPGRKAWIRAVRPIPFFFKGRS